MFLVEYQDNQFINAEDIQWVSIEVGVVKFTFRGDSETLYTVANQHCPGFVNNLQALNGNFDIERRWHDLNGASNRDCHRPAAIATTPNID